MEATFSVVVGSVGRETIRQMLDSIAAQPRIAGDQCIVCIDAFEQGPRDDIQAIVRSYGPGFLACAHDAGSHWLGVAQVNVGLQAATGSHVLLLGDDDVFLPHLYETIRPICSADPTRAVLWRVLAPHHRDLGQRAILGTRLQFGQIGGSSIAAPRPFVGPHRTDPILGHDFDWLVNVIHASGRDPIRLDDVLVVTRYAQEGYDPTAVYATVDQLRWVS